MGMTEMVRCIIDNSKRIIGKRCFGKISYGLKVISYDKGMQIYNKPGLFLLDLIKKSKLGFQWV